MGRREPLASPSVAVRTGVQIANHQFATIHLQVRSLMLEAKVLREEATALRAAPLPFGDHLHRCGLLHRQALVCSTEALELMRVSCHRPERFWE